MAIATPGRIAETPRRRIVRHQVIRRRRLAAPHPIRLRATAAILRTRRQLIVALPRRARTEEAVVAAAMPVLLAEAAVIRAAVAAVTGAVRGQAVEAGDPTEAAVLQGDIRLAAPLAADK